MAKFLGKRILFSAITLLIIITATFFLLAGAPGDPIASKVELMPEQAQQVIRAKYGLDKPVLERYKIYMKNLLTKGDFGESIIYTGKTANDVIKQNALCIWENRYLGLDNTVGNRYSFGTCYRS